MNVRHLVLSIFVIGAAGCGQSSVGQPTAQRESIAQPSTGEDVRITVTLADAGCELQGAAEIAAGSLTVELVNETEGRFDLDLWRLNEGHEYDELAAYIAEEMERMQAGEEPLGHPDFAELVAEATANGASGELRTDLTAGRYGLACISFATPERPTGIWATGPLRAS